MTPFPETELEEVLSSFSVSGTTFDAKVLREWVQRYPQYEHELTDLAASLAEKPGPVALDATAEKAFVARGMQQVAAILAKEPAPSEARPLTGIFDEAERRGYSSDDLAGRVGLPVTILAMLDQRLFRFSSITAAVYEALSYALEIPERAIAAFLQGAPRFAEGAAFKSKKAPKLPEQVDFLEELKLEPSLTDADRARWASAEGEEA